MPGTWTALFFSPKRAGIYARALAPCGAVFDLSAAVVQVLIVLLQLFAPAIAQSWILSGGARAFGIFQQPNVLTSFIAAGSALASPRPGRRSSAATMVLV